MLASNVVTHPDAVSRAFDAIPLLACLSPAQRAAIAFHLRTWHALSGAVVFDVGDACPDLSLSWEGTIRVCRPLATGHDILLYRLQPGEPCIMSTACFLGGAAYPVRKVVEREVHGITMPGRRVQEILAVRSPFRDALFAAFADRLGGLLTLLEELVTRRLDRRLASLLLERGPVISVTYQLLVEELLSAREVISRLLESFEAQGYVRLHRARIEVLNAQALAALLDR